MSFFGLTGRARIATAAVTVVACGALVVPAWAGPTQSASSSGSGDSTSVVEQAASAGTITSRVRGTFGRNGTVTGTFMPDRFFVKRGQAYANGVLRATLRRSDGGLVGGVTKRITIPVRNGSANAASQAQVVQQAPACDILNLVLGPLDLNLLGLEVHLKRVVLDIVARPGAGNLLGNLLCAVAGLLDGTGLLNALRLSNVLNRILGILGV